MEYRLPQTHYARRATDRWGPSTLDGEGFPMQIRTVLVVALVLGLSETDRARGVPENAVDDPPVVDMWNAYTDFAIVEGAGRPPRAEYHFALAHAAMYDAAMAIDGSYTPIVSAVSAPRTASIAAAIATAAHDTLVGLLPLQTADLDAKYAATLALIPDRQARVDGIAAGRSSAAAVLAKFAASGFGVDRPEYYVPLPPGPGVWIPVSGRGVAPWIGHEDPFTTLDPEEFTKDQFKLAGPPNLASDEWAEMFNLTKAYGSRTSTVRTPEQSNLALFWAENPTPRIWNRAVVAIANSQSLDELAKVRLYTQVHVSSADATIACWLVKYTEQSWRPLTAITTSFDDGNPATETDPTWQPFGATPNHPEYPSGHACSTGAITTALRHFFGTDEFTFTVESHAPGLTQNFITYSRFSDAENDVNLSRIYLGIHFWGAQVDGTRLGERIGQQVHSRAFRPTLDLAEYVGSGAVSRRFGQLWEALSSPPIASRTMRRPAMSR